MKEILDAIKRNATMYDDTNLLIDLRLLEQILTAQEGENKQEILADIWHVLISAYNLDITGFREQKVYAEIKQILTAQEGEEVQSPLPEYNITEKEARGIESASNNEGGWL